MNFRAELWVRLKVTDLVAQTAWMTLTEKLDFSADLEGLVRYSFWGMDVEGAGAREVLDQIDRAIRHDSTFTNQNKHHYSLTVKACLSDGEVSGSSEVLTAGDLDLENDYPVDLRNAGDMDGQDIYACDLLVRELRSERENGFASRLNARLDGAVVSRMKAGETWRLMVRASGEKDAVRKVEEMAVTRSRRDGLLLNPHYQSFEMIGTRAIQI